MIKKQVTKFLVCCRCITFEYCKGERSIGKINFWMRGTCSELFLFVILAFSAKVLVPMTNPISYSSLLFHQRKFRKLTVTLDISEDRIAANTDNLRQPSIFLIWWYISWRTVMVLLRETAIGGNIWGGNANTAPQNASMEPRQWFLIYRYVVSGMMVTWRFTTDLRIELWFHSIEHEICVSIRKSRLWRKYSESFY